MEFNIFRTKNDEYWDIWSEYAIVFPKDKPIHEVFTDKNIRKLLKRYDKKEFPTIVIRFVNERCIDVAFYYEGENASNCTEINEFRFVKMMEAVVVF